MDDKHAIAELRRLVDQRDLRIEELEDLVEQQEKNIESLTDQLKESGDVHTQMIDHQNDCHDMIEHWIEAFDMVLTDNDSWSWKPWIDDQLKLSEEHNALIKDWNKFIKEYNAVVAPKRRNFGRPLAAGPLQQKDVLERRKRGQTLRDIAYETGLGVRTIRTVIDKKDGVDRATLARLEKIVPDKMEAARERSRMKTIRNLPGRINGLLSESHRLTKVAKGLSDEL